MNTNESYRLKINTESVLDISGEQLSELDIIKINERHFHLIRNNKTYQVEIESFNIQKKAVALKVNGNKFSASLEDHYDLLVNKMGLSVNKSVKINEIKAPMPGLVLDISVQPGTTVEKGDPLLILEAMKMENVIKSPGPGIVKTVEIEKGQAVEKNTLLITLD